MHQESAEEPHLYFNLQIWGKHIIQVEHSCTNNVLNCELNRFNFYLWQRVHSMQQFLEFRLKCLFNTEILRKSFLSTEDTGHDSWMDLFSTKIYHHILRHCCVHYHSSGMRQIYISVLVTMAPLMKCAYFYKNLFLVYPLNLNDELLG